MSQFLILRVRQLESVVKYLRKSKETNYSEKIFERVCYEAFITI